jgi:predicted NBD/HSP70 family sugar kinase
VTQIQSCVNVVFNGLGLSLRHIEKKINRMWREERTVQQKAGSDLVRRQNRGVVIAALRRRGRLSRTELSSETSLSPSTVSAITSDLLSENALLEVREPESGLVRRGRPQIALALNPARAAVAAAELSLNRLSVTIADYAGGILSEKTQSFVTSAVSSADTLARMTGAVRASLEPVASELSAIVVAVQGRTDAKGRDLLWSPISPGRDVQLADVLEAEFSAPVTIANDCSMMAAALRWQNSERYGRDFLAVLLSHGIGMGLYLNGKLFSGTRSSAAEFGHMQFKPGGALCRCGSRGCIEAYAGDYAIWRAAQGQPEDTLPPVDLTAVNMRALAGRARAAEGREREAYRQAAAALGHGLANLFALIDPVPVAFVGSGTAAFDIMKPDIEAAIKNSNAGSYDDLFDFDLYDSETPLIQLGSIMTALQSVDEQIASGGEAIEGLFQTNWRAIA